MSCFNKQALSNALYVTSFAPSHADIKGEETGEGYTEKLMQYEIYQKMLNGKTSEVFEDEVKKRFIDEPAQMKLLIVVDKLLTGFDAPSATYLYIDKNMKDHSLFQAICRVNRLDGDDKEYDYIIDYKDLFGSLEHAFQSYTSNAFDGLDSDDVQGLLSDRIKKGKERLDDALEVVKALCEDVAPPKSPKDYVSHFCGNTEIPEDLKNTEPKRVALYKAVISLIRAFANIADEMEEAGYVPKQIESIKIEIKHFENVRKEIQLASGDYIDLKKYEPAMRHLIDSYIGAEDSQVILSFDDFSLVDLLVRDGKEALDKLPKGLKGDKEAVAETIENNLRKVIIEETPTNPIYYEKMSVLLDELIKLRNQGAIDYEEYLKKIIEHAIKVKKPNATSQYPSSLNSGAKRALYDNLNKNEPLALALDDKIANTKDDDWRGTTIKKKKVKNAIREVLNETGITEELEVERILEIVFNQKDY